MRFILLAVIGLGLVACNGSSEQPQSTQQESNAADSAAAAEAALGTEEENYEPAFPQIELKDWKLAEYEYEGRTFKPRDAELSLRIKDGQLSGNAGCNDYSAEVTLREDGTMGVGEISSSKKICQGKMTQEDRFLKILRSARSYSVNKIFLEINSELGKLSMRAPLKQRERQN